MLRTLQIQDGAVLICGPTSTGKTVLAKRLLAEMPYREKVLISSGEIYEELLT